MTRLTILALDGCLASTVFGLAELVRMANQIGKQVGSYGDDPIEAVVASLDGAAVQTEDGAALTVEASLSQGRAQDVLVVPGCMTHTLDVTVALTDRKHEIGALKRWYANGGVIAAHCSSIFLLAEAGLLDGRKATATWWAQAQMKDAYPKIEIMSDDTLTDSERLICAAGPFSHLDLGLHLIEKMASRSLASLVAKFAMIERSPPSQAAFRTMELTRHAPPLAKRFESLVLKSLPVPPAISEVARQLGLTTRTLQRRLLEAMGKTPQSYMNEIRMGVAKSLIETSAVDVGHLMAATGFSDESAFRRQFKQASGMTPKQYRERYGVSR